MKRKVFWILAVIGFFLILGAFGNADLADKIGKSYPLSIIIFQSAIGFILMVPAVFNEIRSR